MVEILGPSRYKLCKNCPVFKERAETAGKPLQIAGLKLESTKVKIFCHVNNGDGITNVFMNGRVERVYRDGETKQEMKVNLESEAVICPANPYKLDTPRK